MSLDSLVDHLRVEAEEGLYHTGGQVYVSIAGRPVLDVAIGVDGLGAPVDEDSLFVIYCSGKPVVALAIAHLVADGELSFEDQIGDVLDLPAGHPLAPVQMGSVMNHTCGLTSLNPLQYTSLLSVDPQQLLEDHCVPQPEWAPGVDLGYSQFLAWYVMGCVIERLQEQPLREFVRSRVLQPLGVTGDLLVCGMTADEYEDHRNRLRINVFLGEGKGHPSLVERTKRIRCLPDPSLGTVGSARGMASFYEALLGLLDEPLQDDGPPPFRAAVEQCTRTRSHGFDRIMQRECGYGYGFMTGLGDHGYGRYCGPAAFGHTAYGGMSAALCDPDRSLVVACHFDGRIDSETALIHWRPAFFEAIYRSCFPDLATTEGIAPPAMSDGWRKEDP